VLRHGWLLWMFKTVVPLMLLQSGFHGTASLSNVDLDALTGDSVYTRCPKSLVIFNVCFLLRVYIYCDQTLSVNAT
jgi:hypothetical protein